MIHCEFGKFDNVSAERMSLRNGLPIPITEHQLKPMPKDIIPLVNPVTNGQLLNNGAQSDGEATEGDMSLDSLIGIAIGSLAVALAAYYYF